MKKETQQAVRSAWSTQTSPGCPGFSRAVVFHTICRTKNLWTGGAGDGTWDVLCAKYVLH